ncbi:hypothetical protein TQ38_008990 [Novosphingobium sp. P6W]|nr:hypothetical protein TQ38_008990 [Novosphingobium sp. P6W]
MRQAYKGLYLPTLPIGFALLVSKRIRSPRHVISRRYFLAALGSIALVRPGHAAAAAAQSPPMSLLSQALGALERHSHFSPERDVVGVVDFSAPSAAPRFHIVDLLGGTSKPVLVAHGRGSDPEHSGWVHSFSNSSGSNASSAGAYLTEGIYEGRHGSSRHLRGLEQSNSNAAQRGLVIHSADYVSYGLAGAAGKIGRSEGCLAVAGIDLATVLGRLGPRRLIFVRKC